MSNPRTDRRTARQRTGERGSGARESEAPLDVPAATAAALRLLSVRARTRAELETRLERRGFPGEVIAGAVERLTSAGLVDDGAFAAEYARSTERRGHSTRLLTLELLRRGVPPDLAGATAETARPPALEAERCAEVASARLARLQGLPRATQARRLSGFLARRGYPPELVSGVVRSVLAEDP